MLHPSRGKEQFRFALALLFAAMIAALMGWAAVPATAQNETAHRDAWQRPNEVMDALGIKSGSVVGDIGAGGGYFTFHFAERVGPSGKVYAEDLRENEMKDVQARAQKENLPQVQTIVGTPSDPKLPVGTLDVILVCNAYHEFRGYNEMIQGMYKALKPGGVMGVIDASAEPGQPRESYYEPHHIPKELVREDLTRNGFQFVKELPGFKPSDEGTRSYYFLIFRKSENAAAVSGQVFGPETVALGGILVRVFNAQRKVVSKVSTESNGTFTIDGLAPGAYKITFTQPGFVSQADSFKLEAGETAQLKKIQLKINKKSTITID